MMNYDYQTSRRIERAVIRTSEEIDKHFKPDGMWKTYSEKELWFELVACILSSRVRFEVARLHASLLLRTGLLNARQIADNPVRAQRAISSQLSLTRNDGGRPTDGPAYPFYMTRSRWLVETALNLYRGDGDGIIPTLERAEEPEIARDELVESCLGVGLKEASLFLRNICYSSDLAILDTHVLSYMQLLEIAGEKKGGSPGRREYLDLESSFRDYAARVHRTVASLDLAVWLVMRLARQRDIT